MNAIIQYYSLSGNNKLFSTELAMKLDCSLKQIRPFHTMSYFRLTLDMLFNRTPELKGTIEINESIQIIISPIWMGKIASPVRSLLKSLRKAKSPYIFCSVSGGALGKNPRIEKELTKRTGYAPLLVIDSQLHNLPGERKGDSFTMQECHQIVKTVTPQIKNVLNPTSK